MFKKLIKENFRKQFIFLPVFHMIMCLMKAPKNFENMRAGFLFVSRCQNSLRQNSKGGTKIKITSEIQTPLTEINNNRHQTDVAENFFYNSTLSCI